VGDDLRWCALGRIEDHAVRLTATGWSQEALSLCRLSPQDVRHRLDTGE
jgi:hypothetical protein